VDSFTFTVEMTKALAWPFAAVVVALALREPLKALLANLTKLKFSDLELGFEKEVAQLEQSASSIIAELPRASADLEIKSQLLSLAMAQPEASIIEAWSLLESRLVSLADRAHLDAAPAVRVMPMVLGALLHGEGVLTDAQYSLLRRMRALRNRATHAPQGSIDIEEASSFVKLAVRLSASMNEVTAAEDAVS